MLTRNYDVRTNQDSLNRAYQQGTSIPPTFSQSIFDHFTESFFTEGLLYQDVGKMLGHAPKSTALQDAYDYANLDLNNPNITIGQKITRAPFNFLSDMIGYTLGGPIGLASAAVGGFAGQAIERGIGALVGEIAPPLARNIGRFAAKANTTGLETVGLTEPQTLLESYEQEKNKFNPQKLAEGNIANYGIGIALHSVGYAAGIIWRKALGKTLKEEIKTPMPSDKNIEESKKILDEGMEQGRITKQEHKFYSDLLSGNKESLEKKANEILLNDGHPIDPVNGMINFQILTHNDVNNLNSAIMDELVSEAPSEYKNSLSHFIIHNRVDEIKNNPPHPEFKNGLKGYVDYASKKIQDIKEKIKLLKSKIQTTEESQDKENNQLENSRLRLEEEYSQLFHEYKKQQSFMNVVNSFVKLMDSDLPNLANPQKVISYLKNRVESKLPSLSFDEETNQLMKEKIKIPEEQSTIELNKETSAEQLKKIADNSLRMLNEFKEKEPIFGNLVKCLLGSSNA